jgi:hypothetical protein
MRRVSVNECIGERKGGILGSNIGWKLDCDSGFTLLAVTEDNGHLCPPELSM